MFWAFFVLIGLVMIFGSILNVTYLDILLGLFVVILGIQKLGEENRAVSIEAKQEKIERNLDQVNHWTNSTYDYINNMKSRHEYRLYHLGEKRSELEEKAENNYREIAKKLFDLENKINELARAGVIAQRPEIRSGRGTDQKINLSVIARSVPVEQTSQKPAATQVIIKEEKTEEKLADLSERQIAAVKVIRSNGKITTKEYTTLFRVSDRTAQNDLKSLVSKGMIKRAGDGAKTHYMMAF